MNTIAVGVGEYFASNTPGEVIKAFTLGSSVGVIFLVPGIGMAGLLHSALPDSNINPTLSKEKPGIFADTGIYGLLNEMQRLGYGEDDRIVVKLTGGGTIMDPNKTFNIGERNLLAVKKILAQYKLNVSAEHSGKSISRTVSVDVDTGTVTLSSPGRRPWKI